ncbi:hypothetical protein HBN50_15755 [Halobacteriovorax sp. GB3]|uniref:hypothetical protein n=1 Tax=Halobacteriovorax sp. GB3 TaxID=2719615 RepID=UPI0023608B56|nr:hypothetical protein [Halobacteriovorax sp. GB3]MDD0854567.1 hypothetical protein [Halobacteriovorax sp. GB3]
MSKFIFIILAFSLSLTSFSQETCSRVAVINYQEVLVDTNSTQKGEGLRYHLEKDEVAMKYLNKYQEGTKTKWQNAALGTVGTSLLLTGLLSSSSNSTKKTLLIGGSAIILVNFLIAKTYERANEENLNRAIEEYNKRNLPRIYFGPDLDSSGESEKTGAKFFIDKSWSF